MYLCAFINVFAFHQIITLELMSSQLFQYMDSIPYSQRIKVKQSGNFGIANRNRLGRKGVMWLLEMNIINF
jgi:hypothetical protein